MSHRDPSVRDLEARLRTDAAAWSDTLSPAAQARLHARLAALPARPAPLSPHWWLPLLVAGGIAAAIWWPRHPRSAAPAPVASVDAPSLEEIALAPLRDELEGLTHDGRALARGMWDRVPPSLRNLIAP